MAENFNGLAQSMRDISSGLYKAERIMAQPFTDNRNAEWQFKKLVEQIRRFEKLVDEGSEVIIALGSFAQGVTMAIRNVGFQDPSLIYFYGLVNGRPAQLIQHINQINFLLTSTPRDPMTERRPIGFEPPTST